MSSHYTRKTKLRNSELLHEAIAILEDELGHLKEIKQEAKSKHKKPTIAPWHWFSVCRAAQYLINTDKATLTDRHKKLASALLQYCGPYERALD